MGNHGEYHEEWRGITGNHDLLVLFYYLHGKFLLAYLLAYTAEYCNWCITVIIVNSLFKVGLNLYKFAHNTIAKLKLIKAYERKIPWNDKFTIRKILLTCSS